MTKEQILKQKNNFKNNQRYNQKFTKITKSFEEWVILIHHV